MRDGKTPPAQYAGGVLVSKYRHENEGAHAFVHTPSPLHAFFLSVPTHLASFHFAAP